MSLQVGLPLNENLNNQGLANIVATNNGATVNNNGKIGKCYSFDGSDDFINLTGADLYKIIKGGNTSFSFAVGVYRLDSTRGILFGDYGTSGSIGFNLEFYASDYSRLRFYGNGSPDLGITGMAIPLNTGTHITITYSGTILKGYINGVNVFTENRTLSELNKTSGSFYLGRDNRTGTTAYYGYLNDVRIYDHALSAKEVKELSKGLVLHYKLSSPYLESTTNLCNAIRPGTGANATGGGHVAQGTNYDATNDPVPFTEGTKGEIVYGQNGSTGGGASRSVATISASSSTPYTYSCYIKPSDNFEYTHANFIYKYEYNSEGTKLTEGGLFNISRTQSVGDGGYRCGGTFTSQATTAKINISFYTYPNKNIEYLLGGGQIEQKDHVTPFTAPNTTRNETIEYDCSGYEYNGTISGTLTSSSDSPRYNGSTVFPSGTNYINAGQGAKITDMVTVNLGINYSTGGNPISCTEGGGGNFENSNGIQFPVYVASVGYKIANSGVAPDTLKNDWHMLTGTFDKTNVKIYIDGVLKASVATGSTNGIGYNNNNAIFVGAEAAGTVTSPASTVFIGNISDVRIYATALSADDILELYRTSASIDNKGNVYAYELEEV